MGDLAAQLLGLGFERGLGLLVGGLLLLKRLLQGAAFLIQGSYDFLIGFGEGFELLSLLSSLILDLFR